MRHYKKGRKLGTDASHTKAIKKNLAVALFTNDRIKTTVTRAKEVRRVIDHIITWAKKGDLHSRRLAIAALGDKELVREVFEKAEQGMWSGRNGGYTRIMKLGPRKGDNAPMAILELVEEEVVPKAKAADDSKKKASKPAAKSGAKAKSADTDEAAAEEANEAEVAEEAEEGKYSAAKIEDGEDERFDDFKEDEAGKTDDINEFADGEADRTDAVAQTDVREDAVAAEKAEGEAAVEDAVLENEKEQVEKTEEENIEKIKEEVAAEEKELLDAVNPVSEDEDAFEETVEKSEKHEDDE